MLTAVLYLLVVHGSCLCQSDSSYSAHSQDFASEVIRALYDKIESADYQLANPSEYPDHYEPQPGEEFDFIVVGAGSAGSVVASRLSEVTAWNVLLVEAGGNPTKTSEIPALVTPLQGSDLDWKYKTDPDEENCLGMVDRRCKWPRGKVLGGSSTINANLYVRGHPKDYNAWEEAGNLGWGYEDVLQYFKKSENLRSESVKKLPNSDFYHGTGGLLQISHFNNSELKELLDAYAFGAQELGYAINPDYNGESMLGFTNLQVTAVDGKRCSAAKAFLSPARKRNNLKVAKHSLATRILIDETSLKAHGIEFINKNGKTIKVKAKNEIIVSGGSINSAQLLMLSGIGPKKALRGIKYKGSKRFTSRRKSSRSYVDDWAGCNI